METRKTLSYSSVVFAGGGSRCLWQVGFWEEVSKALELTPRRIAAVSAGAAMACLLFSGKTSAALERFKDATARNRRNVYLSNLFSDTPVFPHYAMYRKAILDALDSEGMNALYRGPDIRVLISRPPRALGPRSATIIGILAYLAEKSLRGSVHPSFGRRLGFVPEVVCVRQCVDAPEVADLVLASSCTPPFTPILSWNGRPALDGGLVDNVPVCALGDVEGDALVLLTRRYGEDKIPRTERLTYVQPSAPIPVSKWDYTNPEGLQAAYDLGRLDGAVFVNERRT